MEFEERRWAKRVGSAFESYAAVGAPLHLPKDVDQAAVLAVIQAGYRALARQHHPDHGGSTTTMQKVNAATHWLRAVLSNALTSGS